jgi:hypothetical protein
VAIELDHFFILTTPGAPEASLLKEIGLVEGPASDHPGQGTANRRFFFANSMLELIYLRDVEQARRGPGSGLLFAERFAAADASPFGLVFKRTADAADAPFPGWAYHADYLSDGRYLHIGDNSVEIREPLCVYQPFAGSRTSNASGTGSNAHSLTRIQISLPLSRPSTPLGIAARADGLSLTFNEPHFMEVTLDGARRGQRRDFRPGLPLAIGW